MSVYYDRAQYQHWGCLFTTEDESTCLRLGGVLFSNLLESQSIPCHGDVTKYREVSVAQGILQWWTSLAAACSALKEAGFPPTPDLQQLSEQSIG